MQGIGLNEIMECYQTIPVKCFPDVLSKTFIAMNWLLRVQQIVEVQIPQIEKFRAVLTVMYKEREQVPYLQITFCFYSTQQQYQGLEVVCHLKNVWSEFNFTDVDSREAQSTQPSSVGLSDVA